jgi:hypothetical protein
MSSNVLQPANFSSKNVSISVPKSLQNQSGAKQAYLNYSGDRLLMQTAVGMAVPFGLNVSEFGPTPTYSVGLSFRGVDHRPELKEFMDKLEELDEKMLTEGVKNSKAWFKADLGRDVIKAFYTPCLKYSKDKEGNVLSYPPTISLKLRKTDGQFDTKFYDVAGNPYKDVPVEELLQKGVQVTAIMECGGVWFAGSKFGVTWRAKQMVVHELPKKMGDFAFKGLGGFVPKPEEDESKEKSNEVDDDEVFSAATVSATTTAKPSILSQMMPQPAKAVVAAVASVVEEADASMTQADDPVDDEDGDDVEPVPVPKKLVVKKKVVGVKK